ncbi:MAG: universal stress protein, partial [Coriobacteriia bacterium]|nr:universal stress protein [Coriobacteriia bacterium]
VMIQIENILYPTDFSPCAEGAMRHAALLADWHQAHLHVVHVVGPDRRERVRDVEMRERRAVERLSALCRETTTSARIITAVTTHPTAWQGVCTYVDEHDVDLVVMGTHGRRGARRLLLGSTAEEVIRRAPCPVMAVCARNEARPPHAIRSIMVPIDFSDLSRLALRYARQLAQTYGARLDLVHVVDDTTTAVTYRVDPWVRPSLEQKEHAQQALADLVLAEVGYEHVVAEVRRGSVVAQLLDYAREHETDLIVMASHGRFGMERFLLGSVAEQILRGAPCPVFTVKGAAKNLLPAPQASEALEPIEKVTSRA